MTSGRRRWPARRGYSAIVALVTVMGLAGAMSACSSSDPSSASKKVIVIGDICSCSGEDASAQGGIPELVNAWERTINKAGGINGYKVQVTLLDDSGDPAKALQSAQTLVQQDHVMAIAGLDSDTDQSFASYLESSGVPVVGGVPFSQSMLINPDYFPSGGNVASANYGMALTAKQQGRTKFAQLVCAESPACADAIQTFDNVLKIIGGLSLVYSTKISAAAPNYTAPCLAAKQANADAIFVESFASVVPRVLDNCAQQNFKPTPFNIASDADGSLALNDPNSQGSTVIEYNIPTSSTSTPGALAFHDAIATYAPSLLHSSLFTDDLMDVWSGLQLFAAAARAGHLTPTSTSADVKNALYSLKNETLDGLAPPLNFVRGKANPVNCWFVATVTDKKLVTDNAGNAECVPASNNTALLHAFGAAS
jgi:branched-chain amino acid transport system substrate-binding protein